MIWSELCSLCSLIDQLHASDSDIAEKLAAINQDLEVLTLTFAQVNSGNGREEDLEGMDPFGCLVVWQQGLLNNHDKLISQIQAQKGFESFLKLLSFDNLHSAAMHGPMIVINHCR